MSILVFGTSAGIGYILLVIHSLKKYGYKFTLEFFLGAIAFALIKESYFHFNVKYYTLPNVKNPIVGLIMFAIGWSYAFYLGYEMANFVIKIKSESDCLNFIFLAGFLVALISFAIETAALNMHWWMLNTDYWYINDDFAPYDLLVGWFLNSYFFYHLLFIATKKLDKYKLITIGLYVLYFVLIPIFENLHLMAVFIAIFGVLFLALDARWGAFILISSFLTWLYQTYKIRNIWIITIFLSLITISWLYLLLTADIEKSMKGRNKPRRPRKKNKFIRFWNKIQYSKTKYADLTESIQK